MPPLHVRGDAATTRPGDVRTSPGHSQRSLASTLGAAGGAPRRNLTPASTIPLRRDRDVPLFPPCLPPALSPHYTTRLTLVPDPCRPTEVTPCPSTSPVVISSRAARPWSAALTAAAWFPAPRRASAHTQQLPAAPAFTPLPSSQLPTGKPIADISAGWDGTLWAVDTLGIPHLYDPIERDLAGLRPRRRRGHAAERRTLFLPRRRRGRLQPGDRPDRRAADRPTVARPAALLYGDLDGASVIDGVIQLYRSGRWVSTATPGTVQALTSAVNWPACLARRRHSTRPAHRRPAAQLRPALSHRPAAPSAPAGPKRGRAHGGRRRR